MLICGNRTWGACECPWALVWGEIQTSSAWEPREEADCIMFFKEKFILPISHTWHFCGSGSPRCLLSSENWVSIFIFSIRKIFPTGRAVLKNNGSRYLRKWRTLPLEEAEWLCLCIHVFIHSQRLGEGHMGHSPTFIMDSSSYHLIPIVHFLGAHCS